MATSYEVRVDGATVWSEDRDAYEGVSAFPAEYRQRPTAGVVELVVDGEVIARQEPLDVEAFLEGVRRDVTGELAVTIDDATAEVG